MDTIIKDKNVCQRYLSTIESAQARNIKFELSLTAYKNLLRRKYCPYTGEKLTVTGNKPNISIDRINNSKGYIPGNVIACSKYANSKKSDMSPEMIMNMAKILSQANQ